ncbi:hypothetical protein BJ944DRAFT_277183 [Cunninghamella echinulata]|nr:hypothetical protein BJ944DRAFT_277183 [Cunninghamella echinulata]
MKLISHLASLSTAATLLLQIGTFVEASPFFTGAVNAHTDDATISDQCQGLIFTLPGKKDTQIENNTKHAVAWTIPKGLEDSMLSLSLVKADDTSKSINIGPFAVKDGATGELPVDIGNYEPGEYYYHLQTNDINGCNVDSLPITINKQQTAPPPPSSDNVNHADAEILDELNSFIPSTSSDSSSNDHFNELIDKLDNLGEDDQSSNEFDALIDQFAEPPVENEQKYANNDYNEYDALISEMPVEGEKLENTQDHSNEDNDEFNAMIQNYAEEEQVKDPKQDKELHVNFDALLDNFQELIDDEERHNDAASINEILDEIAHQVNKKKNGTSSHNNDINKDEQHKLESFDEFIASLDQDYAQYIKNNKESKPDNTMHKNSDDLNIEEPNSNAKFFTNSDLRTQHKSNAKRGDRTSHTDAAPVDNYKQPVWYTAPYFTNDYQVTPGHDNDAGALSWEEDIDVKPPVDHNDAEPANVEWEQENDNNVDGQWAQDHIDANIDEDFAFNEDSEHFDGASVAWATPENTQEGHDDVSEWTQNHVDANIDEDFSFKPTQANVEWADNEGESNWIVPDQQHKNEVNEDEVNEWSEEELVHGNDNETDLQWAQDHVDANIDEDFAFNEDSEHFDGASVAWATPEDTQEGHGNVSEWSQNHTDANIDEDFSFTPNEANVEWEHNDEGEEANVQWSEDHIDANINEDFAFNEDGEHYNDASVAWVTPEDTQEGHGNVSEWSQNHTDANIDEDFSFTPNEANVEWEHTQEGHGNVSEWSQNHTDANIDEDFSFTPNEANVEWADNESESNWIVPEQQQQQQQQQHNDEDVYTHADDHWNSEEHNAYSDWVVPENEEDEKSLENEPAHVDDASWISNTIDELEYNKHENERLSLQTDVIEDLDSTDSLHWNADSIEVGNDDEIDNDEHLNDDEWYDADEFLEQNLSWASDSILDDNDEEETNDTNPTFSENQALDADVTWLHGNSNEDESHDDAAVEWQENVDDDDVEALHANANWVSENHVDDSNEVHDDGEWNEVEDDIPTAQNLSWAVDSVMADDDFTFQANSEWSSDDHSNVDDAFFAESGWEED